jgi:hypothetical protein
VHRRRAGAGGGVRAGQLTSAGRAAAVAAAVLAVASATVSAYWTAGGTALLDTVGGAVESLARERSGPALLLGTGVVLAKLVAAVLAVALLLRPVRRGVRLLALLAGALLTLWGAANVLLGGAVLTGVLDLGPVADERALRWHVLLWDAWFLLWGIALLVAVAGAARSVSGAGRWRPGRRAGVPPAPPAPGRRPRHR